MSGNNTFLSWLLEFLNSAAPGLIAVFGNALCYLSVKTDDDLFLLCKFEFIGNFMRVKEVYGGKEELSLYVKGRVITTTHNGKDYH